MSADICSDIGCPVSGQGMGEAEELLAHIAAALALHARRLRSEGLPVPPALLVAATWATDCVRTRQVATSLDRLVELLDGERVEKMLLTKDQAATALGVSVRTLDRVVASGALTLVKVEGSARIRRADLDGYVAGLSAGSAVPAVELAATA
ncbi:DNA binding domain-containing protein, excisionase family [Klenkia soli]|uniref:DNA binding domain-containing protein, excisionase family n=1 Tax=Klenkia soli TaxID=1052260 RepID=A0A1H0SXU5_9ACTN|nr:helix-turn-helix domain-containing protein [Klenkia soli]SDP46401.1 DNA binding domain-containing protein, excisionase family [Klenkia soli]